MSAIFVQWMLNNKIATLLAIACIAISTLLVFARIEVAYLSTRLETVKAQNETKDEIIKGWVRVTKKYAASADDAREKVADLEKSNGKLRDKLRNALIPKDCDGAVAWARVEAEKAMSGWSR